MNVFSDDLLSRLKRLLPVKFLCAVKSLQLAAKLKMTCSHKLNRTEEILQVKQNETFSFCNISVNLWMSRRTLDPDRSCQHERLRCCAMHNCTHWEMWRCCCKYVDLKHAQILKISLSFLVKVIKVWTPCAANSTAVLGMWCTESSVIPPTTGFEMKRS